MATKELYGSRTYTASKAFAATGKRVFIAGWKEVLQGTAAGIPNIGDPFPYRSDCKASSMTVTPYGKNKTGTLSDEYEYGKVEIDYTTPAFDEMKAKYTYEIGADMLEVGQGRNWGSAEGAVVDVPVYQLVPMVEVSIQKTILIEPTSSLIGKVGSVNDSTWYGWPRGRVLYLGANTAVEWTGLPGVFKYNVTWKFRINPVREHNEFYNPDIKDWQIIIPVVYPYQDLME